MYIRYLIFRKKVFIIFTYIILTLLFNLFYLINSSNIHTSFLKRILEEQTNEKTINNQQDAIDIVYTWVNGSDFLWRSSFNNISKKNKIRVREKLFKMRFVDGEELRFSLRSIEKYAINIVRYIFIIVANNSTQIPHWLNLSHPKIRIVTHHMIFGSLIPEEYKNDSNSIFNFNSVAIENCLANIPGLSNEFVYFNDDFFIGQPVQKSDFFDSENRPKIYSNERNYNDIKKINAKYSKRGLKDFGFLKYEASLTYTLLLFQEKFKKIAYRDPSHVCFPVSKSLLIECKELFLNEINETIKHQFRSINDVKMQFITFQYGYLTNKIVTINVSDEKAYFATLTKRSSLYQLEKIAQIKPKFFAVNCDNHVFMNRFKALLFVLFNESSSFELKTNKSLRISTSEINYWKNRNNTAL